MFEKLYMCRWKDQTLITERVLSLYFTTFFEKHPNIWETQVPTSSGREMFFMSRPFLDQQLDAADAEFENARIEFANGLSQNIDHSERTQHFATAIRSTVLAKQINRWLQHYPDQHENWRHGRRISGPTFLEDPSAAEEAAIAWSQVDDLLARYGTLSRRFFWRGRERKQQEKMERSYADWEKLLP